MAVFHPKLVSIDGEMDGFILLDNVFCHEECIEYSKKHRFNIKFICGTYTCATEILCKMQEAGYELKFCRAPVMNCGEWLYDDFYVKGYYKGD